MYAIYAYIGVVFIHELVYHWWCAGRWAHCEAWSPVSSVAQGQAIVLKKQGLPNRSLT